MNEESIFAAAIAISDQAERTAFLDRECVGNSKLRCELEELIACHRSSNPLDRPAYELPTDRMDAKQSRPTSTPTDHRDSPNL